jgi:hypothetical protein
MRRLIFVSSLFLALMASAMMVMGLVSAQAVADQTGGLVATSQPQAQKDDAGKVAIVQAPPVVVEPKATVAFGDYAGAFLEWFAAALGPVLAGLLANWLLALAKKAGIETTDAQRAKLQEIIENGISLGAHRTQADLSGKLNYDVKNQIVANAVTYAQAHGADTLKSLGLDPTSPAAIEAIQARATKVLADKDATATAVAAGVAPATPPVAATVPA